MQSNKMASGMFSVECIPFPKFSDNKDLLVGKTCHIIEPYDDGKLISVFSLKHEDGSIFKILDENGIHLSPDEAGPIEKEIVIALNIGLTLGVRQTQLFFSIKDEPILVDVHDGKNFISPGMLSDIYGKRMNTQKHLSTELFDPNKEYGAVIKPKIVCYSDDKNQKPIYVKG